MALPVALGDVNLRWPDYPSQNQFFVGAGGLRYGIFQRRIARKLEAWVSTDSGETWSEADDAHNPQINTDSGTVVCFAAVREPGSDEIWVAYNDTGNSLSLIPFNTASGLWDTASKVTGGPVIELEDSNDPPGRIHMVRRSTGEFVFAIEARPGGGFYRTELARYDGSWTSGITIGDSGLNENDPAGLVVGLDDRVHVFTQEFLPAVGATRIRHVCLDSSNSLHALQVVSTATASPVRGIADSAGHIGPAHSYIDGSSVVLIIPYFWRDSSASPQDRVYAATAISADEPTWTEAELAEVEFSTVPDSERFGCAALSAGSNGYVFHTANVNRASYSRFSVGGGWEPAVEWFADPDFSRITNPSPKVISPSGPRFGMLYFSEHGLRGAKYNEMPSVDVRHFAQFRRVGRG